MRPGRRPLRLRIRAQWDRQPLHAVRAARRLALRQGDGSSRRRGLRSRLERLGRYPLLRCPDNRSGPGQSQHPQQSFALRGLPGRRSPAAGRAVRMALHAKARQLAQPGGGNSASCRPSVSTAASPTNKSLSRKSPPGSTTATPFTPRPDWRFTTARRTHRTQAPLPVKLTEWATRTRTHGKRQADRSDVRQEIRPQKSPNRFRAFGNSGRAPALPCLKSIPRCLPLSLSLAFAHARRMRPLSVGRVENAFPPATDHIYQHSD